MTTDAVLVPSRSNRRTLPSAVMPQTKPSVDAAPYRNCNAEPAASKVCVLKSVFVAGLTV
jgi:hypothetical protein